MSHVKYEFTKIFHKKGRLIIIKKNLGMPINKAKGSSGKLRSLGMKKILPTQKTLKSGITVKCAITWSKRKYL